MKRGTQFDEDMPSGRARIIRDFLPPPDQLVMPTRHVKITILLDERSVDFFKVQAQRHGTKYQRMMREVLTRYAHIHSERPAA